MWGAVGATRRQSADARGEAAEETLTQACRAERGQRQKAAPSLDVKFSFLPAKGFLDVCYSHSFLLMPCLPPVENAHLDVSGKPTRVLL